MLRIFLVSVTNYLKVNFFVKIPTIQKVQCSHGRKNQDRNERFHIKKDQASNKHFPQKKGALDNNFYIKKIRAIGSIFIKVPANN